MFSHLLKLMLASVALFLKLPHRCLALSIAFIIIPLRRRLQL
jgi:hypothetical protein